MCRAGAASGLHPAVLPLQPRAARHQAEDEGEEAAERAGQAPAGGGGGAGGGAAGLLELEHQRR